MKKLLIVLSGILGLCLMNACTSETEKKGMNAVAQLYGGSVSVSKGVSSSTKNGNNKYIEITLSEPTLLKTEPEAASKMLLNAAYTLFLNQTPEERNEYDMYEAEIDFEGKSYSLDIPKDQLLLIHKNSNTVLYTAAKLAQGNYKETRRYFHPALQNIVSEKFLQTSFKKSIDSLQKVNETCFTAITMEDGLIEEIDSTKTTYINYVVMQNCKNGIRYFNIKTYPKTANNIVYIELFY